MNGMMRQVQPDERKRLTCPGWSPAAMAEGHPFGAGQGLFLGGKAMFAARPFNIGIPNRDIAPP